MMTPEFLHSLFVLDEDDGTLYWKPRIEGDRVKQWNAKWAGKKAGSVNGGGYVQVQVLGKKLKAHRIVWAMTNGVALGDDIEIDHEDGVRTNNRPGNLRDATKGQNQQNTPAARSNSSGLVGANWHKPTSSWQARITVGKKQKYLGLFDSAEAAHEAYLAAKKELHTFSPVPRAA